MSEATILIAEDEALAAMDLAESVKDLGHEVADIVSSGSAAVARAAQLKPDLVLMDIQLQGEKDGIMAAEVISNEFGIPVVYLTAHTDPKTVERARRTKPSGYLVKPLDRVRLQPAIEKALADSASERQEGVTVSGKGNILLIDQDNQVQAQVAIALGRQHRVKIASSLATATQLLAGQTFDLVMVDIGVADGGGQGVVRRLQRELGVKAPIIVLGEKLKPETIAFLKPHVAAIVFKSPGLTSKIRDEVAALLKAE